MKQYVKELFAMCLFIISILWLFGTAGALDYGNISLGQAIVRLAVGIVLLFIATVLINCNTEGGEWIE